MANTKNKTKELAIRVKNISKEFRVPHEKETSLKGSALKIFKRKSYEKFKALDNVSFEVKKGEFFGIIGRNGSGKSTLLKILSGIYVPDSGTVEINGKLSPFLELGVGFNKELSGRENLYLGGAILGLKREEVDEKFDKIVKFAELEEFIDMKLKNYSSGMQVRLAFSLSINVHAEILLMDEVLAVGDTNFQSKCIKEFRRYRDEGKTVVLVAHDINVVQKYCDRAVLLRNSKVESIGKSREVAMAYLNYNIKDYDKSNIITDEVYKSKYIHDIKVMNKKRARVATFRTGELINIEITYNNNGEINPIYGLVIEDNAANKIFATNTYIIKPIINIHSNQDLIKVRFEIENLLSTGQYYISPAIASKDLANLEWKDKMAGFRVVNDEYNSGGIIDLKHRIFLEDK